MTFEVVMSDSAGFKAITVSLSTQATYVIRHTKVSSPHHHLLLIFGSLNQAACNVARLNVMVQLQ
jgi:hypothetical protein